MCYTIFNTVPADGLAPLSAMTSAGKVPTKSRSYIHIDGLMQERRNSSALAMELRLSCTNPSIWD